MKRILLNGKRINATTATAGLIVAAVFVDVFFSAFPFHNRIRHLFAAVDNLFSSCVRSFVLYL